jgi:RNA polymerase sigma factor (sigma-70 family)
MKESELLEKLKTRNSDAIYQLYEGYYPMIRKMIIDNSGSSHDAKDIFQETILILIKNIKKDDFILTSSIQTYIYSISKNLWLKKIRTDKRSIVFADDLNNYSELKEETAENQTVESHKYVKWLISKIPVHCQIIVKYIYFLKYSIETVAGKMGYNNPHTASNMKYKCLKQMKEMTKMNPI